MRPRLDRTLQLIAGMIIALKMSGLLTRYLPADAKDGRADIELPEGTTVAGLLRQLGIPGEGSYLIVVNDSTIPRDKRDGHVLSAGDAVAIVPPLRGG